MVPAAYASGATPARIGEAGSAMRFTDVARWTIGRMGIAGSDLMERFLRKLLKCYCFEEMRMPLGVVATDVVTGEAVIFRDRGDVVLPIRASCSYPGLFQPVPCGDRLLVDGAMSTNMFHVINRCFQILHSRTEITWRHHSDLAIEPEVRGMEWDAFDSAKQLIKAGEEAAVQALPRIQAWTGLPQIELAG